MRTPLWAVAPSPFATITSIKCLLSPLTSLSHLFEDFCPHFLSELMPVERGWRGIFDYELIVKILLTCQKIQGSLDNLLDVQVQRQKSNPSTTMLHCWGFFFFACSVHFSPKLICFHFNQITVFWTHLSSELPEVLYFVYVLFGKTEIGNFGGFLRAEVSSNEL